MNSYQIVVSKARAWGLVVYLIAFWVLVGAILSTTPKIGYHLMWFVIGYHFMWFVGMINTAGAFAATIYKPMADAFYKRFYLDNKK